MKKEGTNTFTSISEADSLPLSESDDVESFQRLFLACFFGFHETVRAA